MIILTRLWVKCLSFNGKPQASATCEGRCRLRLVVKRVMGDRVQYILLAVRIERIGERLGVSPPCGHSRATEHSVKLCMTR